MSVILGLKGVNVWYFNTRISLKELNFNLALLKIFSEITKNVQKYIQKKLGKITHFFMFSEKNSLIDRFFYTAKHHH